MKNKNIVDEKGIPLWLDGDGRYHRIKSMSENHIRRTIAYLVEKQESFTNLMLGDYMSRANKTATYWITVFEAELESRCGIDYALKEKLKKLNVLQ